LKKTVKILSWNKFKFWSYEEDGVGLYEKEIKPFAIDESVSVVKIVEKGVVCIAAEEWAVEIWKRWINSGFGLAINTQLVL